MLQSEAGTSLDTSLPHELRETLSLVLAGGQGERLMPLTTRRAKPAVPFGGVYRIIDFTLSNCIHSGLRRIFVLTQYQARSLEEHIRFGWNFLPRRLEQFISPRPPHHGGKDKWYRGTADAICQNIDTITEQRPRHVLILSGDHIYRMDYGRMLAGHIEHEAALTIGSVVIPKQDSQRFGVFEVDDQGRVLGFHEKVADAPEIPGRPGFCLGSMGIYIFEPNELIRRLNEDDARGDSTHDFGRDIIPRMIGEVPVYVHPFCGIDGELQPYWRDVGTLDSYYEANLDLVNVTPQFDLYDHRWPTYTLWHNEPPAKTVFDDADGRRAEVVDSLLCPGVIVSGARARRSILSNRVRLEERSEVEDSILFAGVTVGRDARVRGAILEKWVEVPAGETVGHDPEKDRSRGFTITDSGIVVVPPGFRFR